MMDTLVWTCAITYVGYFLMKLLLQQLVLNHVTHETPHIGILCKCAYILGLIVPKIEEQKLLFFKNGRNEGQSLRSVSSQHVLDRISDNSPQYRVLIISFAGGAVRIGGLSRLQLKSTFTDLLKLLPKDICLDQVYAMDPTGMSWYSYNSGEENFTGWQALSAELTRIVPLYDCVLVVGFCMGATAAAMVSEQLVLPAEGQCVLLLFNPQTEICSHKNPKYRIGSWFLGRGVCDGVLGMMRKLLDCTFSCEHTCTAVGTTRCYFHFSSNPHEGQQAARLLDDVSPHVIIPSQESSRVRYVCSPLTFPSSCLLARDGDTSGRDCNFPVSIHEDCSEHALLRHLRDNGDLLRLLKFHIMDCYSHWSSVPVLPHT